MVSLNTVNFCSHKSKIKSSKVLYSLKFSTCTTNTVKKKKKKKCSNGWGDGKSLVIRLLLENFRSFSRELWLINDICRLYSTYNQRSNKLISSVCFISCLGDTDSTISDWAFLIYVSGSYYFLTYFMDILPNFDSKYYL